MWSVIFVSAVLGGGSELFTGVFRVQYTGYGGALTPSLYQDAGRPVRPWAGRLLPITTRLPLPRASTLGGPVSPHVRTVYGNTPPKPYEPPRPPTTRREGQRDSVLKRARGDCPTTRRSIARQIASSLANETQGPGQGSEKALV